MSDHAVIRAFVADVGASDPTGLCGEGLSLTRWQALLSRHPRITRAIADEMFLAAAKRLHVERWTVGISGGAAYQREYAQRSGAVHMWALVVWALTPAGEVKA